MNKMVVHRDSALTEGYLVPIAKPGKDPMKPESYRPVKLLSSYRKLLSQIILNRIYPIIPRQMSPTQFAFWNYRSTWDVVLAHEILIAGAKNKYFNELKSELTCIRHWKEARAARYKRMGAAALDKAALGPTTLQVKRGKNIG